VYLTYTVASPVGSTQQSVKLLLGEENVSKKLVPRLVEKFSQTPPAAALVARGSTGQELGASDYAQQAIDRNHDD
jgi:hypothetical protein